MKTILLLALAAIPVSAQIGNGTVAGLPAASGYTNKITIVTDCTSAYDCSVGGGSAFGAVRSNGSAWVLAFTAFDPASPGAIGGTTPGAGSFTTLNATTPGGSVSIWKAYGPYLYTNSAFIAASTTATITVATLPANVSVDKVYVKTSEAFAGTGITSATCSLGVSGDTDYYLSPVDVFQAVANTTLFTIGGSRAYSSASHDLILSCVSNTNWGNGSATVATAGGLAVYVSFSVTH